MATSRELIEFAVAEPAPLRRWLDQLLAADTGAWVNLEPVVPEVDVAQLTVRRGIMGWLSARADDLPFVTVVGPAGAGPASLGIQHGAGPKAARRLEAAGIAVPPAWELRQDHPKRGLVYEQTDRVDADATLTFVFAAVAELCPTGPYPTWSAVLHRPS